MSVMQMKIMLFLVISVLSFDTEFIIHSLIRIRKGPRDTYVGLQNAHRNWQTCFEAIPPLPPIHTHKIIDKESSTDAIMKFSVCGKNEASRFSFGLVDLKVFLPHYFDGPLQKWSSTDNINYFGRGLWDLSTSVVKFQAPPPSCRREKLFVQVTISFTTAINSAY